MLNRLTMTPALYDYLFSVSLREPELLGRLREETSHLPDAEMQVPAEQGRFLGLLVQLIHATRALEIGVFTGYSSLCTALALPSDGRLVACDISPEWTAIARRYWEEAGVADQIDLHLGPAVETLDRLLRSQEESFDFVFIDADKVNYVEYYERCLRLVRPGGLMVIDNVLRSGQVIDPAIQEPGTLAVRRLNEMIHDDNRVDVCLLPVADGVTLVRKRDCRQDWPIDLVNKPAIPAEEMVGGLR